MAAAPARDRSRRRRSRARFKRRHEQPPCNRNACSRKHGPSFGRVAVHGGLGDRCDGRPSDRETRIRRFIEHINIINHRKLVVSSMPPGQPLDMASAEVIFGQLDPRHRPPGVNSAADYLNWIESEYQRVAANYDERRSWAGISIARRAREVGLVATYDLQFVLGSEATHSGAATLTNHYAVTDGTVSILHGPQVPAHSFVLALAAQTYGHLLEVVARHLGMARVQAELGQLGNEYLTTFA
jgi:hypothetical protein